MSSIGTKLINIDLDGVLTDWMKHTVALFDIPEDFYFQPGCWDTVPAMLDYLKIHSQEFWLKQTPEFWATMPWTTYGKELLKWCEWCAGADNCRILSTPANAFSAHGKVWWMEYQMPYYHERRYYHLTKHKEELANPNKLLLDDCDENINKFREKGGKAILIPTKYNSAHSEVGSIWMPRVISEIKSFIHS